MWPALANSHSSSWISSCDRVWKPACLPTYTMRAPPCTSRRMSSDTSLRFTCRGSQQGDKPRPSCSGASQTQGESSGRQAVAALLLATRAVRRCTPLSLKSNRSADCHSQRWTGRYSLTAQTAIQQGCTCRKGRRPLSACADTHGALSAPGRRALCPPNTPPLAHSAARLQ